MERVAVIYRLEARFGFGGLLKVGGWALST